MEEQIPQQNTQGSAPVEQARPPIQQEGRKPKSAGWWKSMGKGEKLLTIVLAVVVLFMFYVALDANKYQAVVHVIEGEGKVGINPTAERLDFGDLSRGTSAVRTVKIQNGTIMPMYVMIFKTGKIGELMDMSNNYFKLESDTEETIEFQVYMPASANIDDTYEGRVYLFKVPTFGL